MSRVLRSLRTPKGRTTIKGHPRLGETVTMSYGAGQPVPSQRVFATDYKDRDAVIALARDFGGDSIVVKHDNRAFYNIVHHARHDLWRVPDVAVVWWPECYGKLPNRVRRK